MTDEDKKLIAEFGLENVDEAMQIQLLSDYYETLNLRAGAKLEEALSDEQLAEFEKLDDAGDDDATTAWVQSVLPQYDEMVAAEAEAVKADIKRDLEHFRNLAS